MTFTKLHRKHEALWMFYFSVFPRMLYPLETILFWRDPCSSTIQILPLPLAHQLGAAPLVSNWSDTSPSKFSKNDPRHKAPKCNSQAASCQHGDNHEQTCSKSSFLAALGVNLGDAMSIQLRVVNLGGRLLWGPVTLPTSWHGKKKSQENFLDDYPSSKKKATWPSRNGDLFQGLGHKLHSWWWWSGYKEHFVWIKFYTWKLMVEKLTSLLFFLRSPLWKMLRTQTSFPCKHLLFHTVDGSPIRLSTWDAWKPPSVMSDGITLNHQTLTGACLLKSVSASICEEWLLKMILFLWQKLKLQNSRSQNYGIHGNPKNPFAAYSGKLLIGQILATVHQRTESAMRPIDA